MENPSAFLSWLGVTLLFVGGWLLVTVGTIKAIVKRIRKPRYVIVADKSTIYIGIFISIVLGVFTAAQILTIP